MTPRTRGSWRVNHAPRTTRHAPMTRPWKLAETNYAYVKAHPFEVAILPLGATEPHNLHLPYGTDCFEADTVGEQICAEAHERGAKVVLLPTIPYGTETNQMAFPLAMNVNPSTLQAVIRDLVDSLVGHGIRKIMLLNSHGGNDLKPVLRELYGKTPAQLFSAIGMRPWPTCSGRSFRIPTITLAKWKHRSAWPIFRTSWPATPTARSPPTTAPRGRLASRRSIAAGSRSPVPGTCSRRIAAREIHTPRRRKRGGGS